MTKEEKERLEDQIGRLRTEISDLEKRIGYMDRALEPVWRIIREIRADIGETHDRDEHGIYILDINRKEERAGLFSRLTYIAEHHGRDFEERRRLDRTSKEYQREAAKIKRSLDRQKLKENKKGSPL